MTRALVLVLVLLSQGSPGPRTLEDRDAYAVYDVAVPAELPRHLGGTRLVIQQTTDVDLFGGTCFPDGPGAKAEWGEALADYKGHNAFPWTLQRLLQLDAPYVIVPKRKVKNSGAFIQVSAVGFDQSRTRAVVYVAYYCGLLCAGGRYHFLERKERTWKEVRPDITQCMWIS